MKSEKVWYSAKELEGLAGLPAHATNITRKAKNEHWASRATVGVKGGGFEYHISSLPKETQQQLGFNSVSELSKREYSENNLDDGDMIKVSRKRLETAIETLEEILVMTKKTMKPNGKVQMIFALYELLSEEEPEQKQALIKIMELAA